MRDNDKEAGIYAKPNPWGYKLNVNHPTINELYRRYKVWKGYAPNFPLSDKQRIEFENYILPKLSPR